MNEGHSILSQIPLTSTLFAPRPARLSYTYAPLPPSLPPTQITEENLTAWVKECDHVKDCLKHYGLREAREYDEWEKSMLKVAPGYMDHGLLTPQRKKAAAEEDKSIESQFSGLNFK